MHTLLMLLLGVVLFFLLMAILGFLDALSNLFTQLKEFVNEHSTPVDH